MSSSSQQFRTPWSRNQKLSAAGVAAVVFTALLAAVVALWPNEDDSATPEAPDVVNPAPDASGEPGSDLPPPDVSLLSGIEPCLDVSADSDLGRDLAETASVIVDGRCAMTPDSPTGAYAKPRQNSELLVARLSNGQLLRDACTLEGETLRDMAETTSGLWVRYDGAQQPAHVPTIWTQGEAGLAPCNA